MQTGNIEEELQKDDFNFPAFDPRKTDLFAKKKEEVLRKRKVLKNKMALVKK